MSIASKSIGDSVVRGRGEGEGEEEGRREGGREGGRERRRRNNIMVTNCKGQTLM